MEKEVRRFLDALTFPILLIVVLWVVHIIKVVTALNFGMFGIYPRATYGLKGVFLSPLVHGDFQHLISNTVPLFVLTFIIQLFYKRVATISFFLIYVLTGLAVWTFARPVYHIGASGVVYGLVAFVFWNGVFRRNVKSIVLALVVTVLYSGYFLGVLPNQEGISWESHLFGGIVGILVSFLFKSRLERTEEKRDPWAQEALEEPKYYFERDVFEKTEQERLLEKEKDDRSFWVSDRT